MMLCCYVADKFTNLLKNNDSTDNYMNEKIDKMHLYFEINNHDPPNNNLCSCKHDIILDNAVCCVYFNDTYSIILVRYFASFINNIFERTTKRKKKEHGQSFNVRLNICAFCIQKT